MKIYHPSIRTLAVDPQAMASLQGNSNSPEALEAAATQFEALLLEEMLKSMRSVNDVLAEDSLFDRNQEQFYQSMYDSQLAMSMVSTGTLGVADQLIEQAHV